MNITDRLQELAILRQLALERFNAAQYASLSALFADIADEIEATLNSAKPLTELKGRRLDRQLEELTSLVRIPTPDITEVPEIEAQWAQTSLATVGLDATIPAASTIAAISQTSLIQGAVLSQWMQQANFQARFELERAARTGIALGLTNQQIAKSIVGLTSQGDKGPEPLKRAKRDSMALTRTAVQTFANEASLAVYRENQDVLRGVEFIATLDSRTTQICAAYDGAVWDFEGENIAGPKLPFRVPPLHFNCRSKTIPVTKTFRELGIDADEIPPGERASAYGPVSSTMNFEQFMNKQGPEWAAQWLGKGRYELYRDKKLTLSQLLDPKTLRPLTLDELRDL